MSDTPMDPSTEGPAYEMTQPLKPIEAFKDRTLVLSGIDHQVAIARTGVPPWGHRLMAPAVSSAAHAAPPPAVGCPARASARVYRPPGRRGGPPGRAGGVPGRPATRRCTPDASASALFTRFPAPARLGRWLGGFPNTVAAGNATAVTH